MSIIIQTSKEVYVGEKARKKESSKDFGQFTCRLDYCGLLSHA